MQLLIFSCATKLWPEMFLYLFKQPNYCLKLLNGVLFIHFQKPCLDLSLLSLCHATSFQVCAIKICILLQNCICNLNNGHHNGHMWYIKHRSHVREDWCSYSAIIMAIFSTTVISCILFIVSLLILRLTIEVAMWNDISDIERAIEVENSLSSATTFTNAHIVPRFNCVFLHHAKKIWMSTCHVFMKVCLWKNTEHVSSGRSVYYILLLSSLWLGKECHKKGGENIVNNQKSRLKISMFHASK